MFFKSSGMKMGEGAEQTQKPDFIQLNKENFKTYERQIMLGLDYNALNSKQGTDYTEREKEVDHLYEKYLEAGKEGELFIKLDGERVVAFMALRKETDPVKRGVIEQFRLVDEHGQEHVIEEFMQSVASEMGRQGFRKIALSPENLHDDVEVFTDVPWFKNSFVIEKKEEELAEAA